MLRQMAVTVNVLGSCSGCLSFWDIFVNKLASLMLFFLSLSQLVIVFSFLQIVV